MSLVPLVWTLSGDSDFTKARTYMVSPAVAENIFSTMRIMERGVMSEPPRGVFSCGKEGMKVTILTAMTIFDLLRSFNCERVA